MKYFLLGLALLPCVELCAQAEKNGYHWVSHVQGRGQETGYRLLRQPAGDLMVLGTFSDSIIFYPDTVVRPSIASIGYFLAKYDTCGRLIWHHSWTASVDSSSGGILLVGMEQDQWGYLYVAFSQVDSLAIEGRRIGTDSRNLVLRLDTEGVLVNHFDPITRSVGNAHPYVADISVSAYGNIALTGQIHANPVLGPGHIEIGTDRLHTDVDTLVGHHRHQAWLGVYTSEGQPQWTQVTHAPNGAESQTIAFDRNDRLYWAGNIEARTRQHSYDIHFGAGSDSLSLDGASGGFLVAYDSVGQFRWVRRLVLQPIVPDTTGDIYVWELEVAPDDAVYLVGKFLGSFWFDSMRIPQSQPFPADQRAIWLGIIKVNADGEAQWSAEIRSENGDNWPHDLGFDRESNLYFGGSFSQDLHLGDVSFQNTHSEYDGFIGSLSPEGIFRWATTIAGNASYTTMVRGIAVSPSGRLFVTGKIDVPAQIGSFSLHEPVGQEFSRFGGDLFLASYGRLVDSLACHCASQPLLTPAFDWAILPNTQTIQFQHLSAAGTEARWSFGDGAQSTDGSPLHTYAYADTFQVCLELSDRCGTSTVCQSVPLTPLLTFACDPQLWQIGPNPVSEQLHIRFSGAICEAYLVRVFDLRGRLIAQRRLEGGRTESVSFDARTWSEGIYVLRIQGNQVEHSLRIQRLD